MALKWIMKGYERLRMGQNKTRRFKWDQGGGLLTK
jgi:hypothetical protein